MDNQENKKKLQVKEILLKIQVHAFWVLVVFIMGIFVGQMWIKDDIDSIFAKASKIGGYIDKEGVIYEVRPKILRP